MPYRSCFYRDCTNTSPAKTMFRFPIHDEDRLNVWIRNTGHENVLNYVYKKELQEKYICAVHFLATDLHHNYLRPRLNNTAVPIPYQRSDVVDQPILEVLKPNKVYRRKSTQLPMAKSNIDNKATVPIKVEPRTIEEYPQIDCEIIQGFDPTTIVAKTEREDFNETAFAEYEEPGVEKKFTINKMEEEIDVKEHNVLDNPQIQNMFPDLTRIKTEVLQEGDGNLLTEYDVGVPIEQNTITASNANNTQNEKQKMKLQPNRKPQPNPPTSDDTLKERRQSEEGFKRNEKEQNDHKKAVKFLTEMKLHSDGVYSFFKRRHHTNSVTDQGIGYDTTVSIQNELRTIVNYPQSDIEIIQSSEDSTTKHEHEDFNETACDTNNANLNPYALFEEPVMENNIKVKRIDIEEHVVLDNPQIKTEVPQQGEGSLLKELYDVTVPLEQSTETAAKTPNKKSKKQKEKRVYKTRKLRKGPPKSLVSYIAPSARRERQREACARYQMRHPDRVMDARIRSMKKRRVKAKVKATAKQKEGRILNFLLT